MGLVDDYRAELSERHKRAEQRRQAKRVARAAQPVRVYKLANGQRMRPGWAKEDIRMLRLMQSFDHKTDRKLQKRWLRGQIGTKAYKAELTRRFKARREHAAKLPAGTL